MLNEIYSKKKQLKVSVFSFSTSAFCLGCEFIAAVRTARFRAENSLVKTVFFCFVNNEIQQKPSAVDRQHKNDKVQFSSCSLFFIHFYFYIRISCYLHVGAFIVFVCL